MRPTWLLVAAFAVVAQAPARPQLPARDAPPEPTGTASISGRVLAADTGAPLADAFVMISAQPARGAAPRPRLHQTTQSDDRGRYTFTDLPAGSFALVATPPMHKAMYLSPAMSFRPEPPRLVIEVADGEARTDVDIALDRAGVLSGRVLDEAGQPMEGVRVQALIRDPRSEHLITPGRSQDTDDYGRFRIYGLPGGEYLVQAEVRDMGGPPADRDPARRSYVATYYPGTTNENEAPRLALHAGEEIGGLDLRLVRERTFAISGVVLDSQGRPAPGAQVMLAHQAAGNSSSVGHQAAPDGTFSFSRLAPGEYALAAYPSSGNGWDPPEEGVMDARVTVTAADVESVTLAMRPGVTLRGQVETAAGSLPSFEPTDLNVVLMPPAELFGGRPQQVSLDEAWRFTAEHVLGRVLVQLIGRMPRGWFLQSVLLGNRDVTDEPLDLTSAPPDATVRLVLNNRPAVLVGHVSDAAGRPAASAGILVFPSDFARRNRQTNRIRFAMSRDEGTYVVTMLPPGEYMVLALDQLMAWDYHAPSTLETMLPHATLVILAEGERRQLDLTIADVRK